MLNAAAAVALSAAVMFVSLGVGVHLSRRTSNITEMLGMMIGMTQGMMTGIAVGYLAGAATDMFVGNLIGIAVGVAFGVAFGRGGGLMGVMDGGMGGMMGGMMGAMLGVMLQYLYDGWAVVLTTPLVLALYLVAMLALVRLVTRATTSQVDPVCGMPVDPRVAISFLHQGRIYYFCAESCRRTFVRSLRSPTGTQAADPAIE